MRRSWLPLLLLLNPISFIAQAETPEEKGLAITIESDKRDTGWSDQFSELKMILRNKGGQESTRDLDIKTLEVLDDGDKSLSLFHTPKDVSGTAFLSYSHALKPDEQWLYLPALKRVKRIASANKSGPFVGSEFAYEDIASQEVEKYKYKWLKDEVIDGKDCFVIERFPQYENSGYQRQIVWLDKTIYHPLKIEYYDRKNALLKTLTTSGYKQYLDKYWRPAKMHMINHQTGKETDLLWLSYRFNNDFTDRDFDRNSLKRSR